MNLFFKIIYGSLLIFVIICCENSVAQDIGSDLKKIKEAYEKSNLIIEQKANTYSDLKLTRLSASENIVVKKKGDRFYNSFPNSEKILNSRYSLSVNHKQKLITITKYSDTFREQIFDYDFTPLLQGKPAYKYSDNKDGTARYDFTFDTGAMAKFSIVYNKTTSYLSKLVFYYSDKSKNKKPVKTDRVIELVFIKNITMPEISDTVFSETKYVELVNGKLALKDTYKNYTLNNYTGN